MNKNRSTLLLVVFGIIVAILFSSCSSAASGTSSLTLLSNRSTLSSLYTPVSGEIEEKECLTIAVFNLVWTGTISNHEALVGKVLQEHKADVLLNSQLYNSHLIIPYIISRSCVHVQGTPARVRK